MLEIVTARPPGCEEGVRPSRTDGATRSFIAPSSHYLNEAKIADAFARIAPR
jgi:hypothetical protein